MSGRTFELGQRRELYLAALTPELRGALRALLPLSLAHRFPREAIHLLRCRDGRRHGWVVKRGAPLPRSIYQSGGEEGREKEPRPPRPKNGGDPDGERATSPAPPPSGPIPAGLADGAYFIQALGDSSVRAATFPSSCFPRNFLSAEPAPETFPGGAAGRARQPHAKLSGGRDGSDPRGSRSPRSERRPSRQR